MDLSIQYKKPDSDIVWDDSFNSNSVEKKESVDNKIIKNVSIGNNLTKNFELKCPSIFNKFFDHIYILNKITDYDNWYSIINIMKKKSINIKYYSRFPLNNEKGDLINEEYSDYLMKNRSIKDRIENCKQYSWIKSLGKLIEKAKSKEHQSILVLLDNVNFHQNSNRLLKKVNELISDDWDIIYLGALEKNKTKRYDILHKATLETMGNFALAIKSNLFDNFIDYCKNPVVNFETFMNTIKMKNSVYVCSPNIIININEKAPTNMMKWNLENYSTSYVKNVNPLVSVIMTCYNSERWIKYSIESILQQTYKNIELIIIDDKSKDKTVDIIKSYRDIDDRIYLIENKQNYGTYVSKNIGIKQSRGQYITFQDSDDYSMLNRIDLQLSKILKGNYMACYGKYLAKNSNWVFCEITLFMRRDCIDFVGYFDSVRVGADTEYRLRLDTLNVPICYMNNYIYTRLDRLMEGNKVGNANSLTNNKTTCINSNVRFIYRQSFKCFHKLLKTKSAINKKLYYVDFPLQKRPFHILYNDQIDKNILEVNLDKLDNYLYKVKL